MGRSFEAFLSGAALPVLALFLFGAMCLAAGAGGMLQRFERRRGDGEAQRSQEGYLVSAALGLLALLLGFTFSMATDRFDVRRELVVQEANAIGTAYLRAQLLPEPHRSRASDLVIRYTDNRIALAEAAPGSAEQQRLLTVNDAMLTDLWAAASAVFDNIQATPFSATYLDSINLLIDLDQARKTARLARVPPEVVAVLFIYLVTSAGVLGHVLKGARGRVGGTFLLALLTLSLILIIDINRPVGGVAESQRPMEDLRRSLAAQPPAVFDKWRGGGAAPIASSRVPTP
jgi:hypothetical protein